MLTKKTIVLGHEINMTDGKLTPSAFLIVREQVMEDGVVIAEAQKHRYAVDVETGDCSHMLKPAVAAEDIAAFQAVLTEARNQYAIWSPPEE